MLAMIVLRFIRVNFIIIWSYFLCVEYLKKFKAPLVMESNQYIRIEDVVLFFPSNSVQQLSRIQIQMFWIRGFITISLLTSLVIFISFCYLLV